MGCECCKIHDRSSFEKCKVGKGETIRSFYVAPCGVAITLRLNRKEKRKGENELCQEETITD